MTFTDTRDRLVDALATVPGVRAHRYRPSVLGAGDAWVLLQTAERGPGDYWSATWRVIVVLSGDEQTAQDHLDALLPTLVDTLDPVAYVDQATPVGITTQAGDLYGVELIARSE